VKYNCNNHPSLACALRPDLDVLPQGDLTEVEFSFLAGLLADILTIIYTGWREGSDFLFFLLLAMSLILGYDLPLGITVSRRVASPTIL
jgi:hypothetical protein